MLPREKYLQKGIDALSDMELLAVIVGRGIKGKDFLSVSRSVLAKMRKDLEKELPITLAGICEVDGIGEVTGMRILAGIELGKRLYDLSDKEKIIIRNSNDAYVALKYIGKRKQEHVVALFLNSRFEVISKKVICIGSLDGVNVLPRDIIIPALEYNASSVVIAHNHPSGDSTPSLQDIELTRRMNSALELVGLTLLDHIVVAKDEWERIEV